MNRPLAVGCSLLLAGVLVLPAGLRGQGDLQNEERRGIPSFVDVTREAGIDFRHISGAADRKDYIFESKGGGVGFLDYDNDGWLDVFLVQGATLETVGTSENQTCRLYRNLRRGAFADITEQAGLDVRRWAMGVTFGDYDNDGYVDIYVTCFGRNVLYRNRHDGTFEDVTERAGVGDPRWSTSAAFGDYDEDGDLDLYVANYLDYAVDRLPPRSANCTYLGRSVMCGPRGLLGARDSFFRNNGDGTFSEVSEAVGAADEDGFYGLGVLWSDLDNDRDLDLYVSNDATPNLLFVNDGQGRFEEQGFPSGLAVSGDGAMQASMGIDAADYDNDGWLDIFVTHFASDFSTLYRNLGNLIFRDVTGEARLQASEWLLVGWGTKFIDVNNDGWKDIVHVNGHVYPFLLDGSSQEAYRLGSTLFLNQADGTFTDVSRLAGAGFIEPLVGRGAAFGDYDNDGDFDMLVANLNDSPRLLRNDRSDAGRWVMVRLADSEGAEPLGARVRLTVGGRRQEAEVRRTVGIYSASDPRVHFGLGQAEVIDALEVFWLDQTVSTFRQVAVDGHYVIDRRMGLSVEEFLER